MDFDHHCTLLQTAQCGIVFFPYFLLFIVNSFGGGKLVFNLAITHCAVLGCSVLFSNDRIEQSIEQQQRQCTQT